MVTAKTKSSWAMCYGIVKTKQSSTRETVWDMNAKDYESAIRQIKKSAQSNYRDSYKEATLFHNGSVSGWAFRVDGKIIYVDKYALQDIGLLPRSKN